MGELDTSRASVGARGPRARCPGCGTWHDGERWCAACAPAATARLDTASRLWRRVLDAVAGGQLSAAGLGWLERLEPAALDGAVLCLTAPTEAWARWVTTRYGRLLAAAAAGVHPRLTVRVVPAGQWISAAVAPVGGADGRSGVHEGLPTSVRGAGLSGAESERSE